MKKKKKKQSWTMKWRKTEIQRERKKEDLQDQFEMIKTKGRERAMFDSS